MVRTLLLVRHAEAARADAGTKDIQRPLTAKGFREASRAGRFLAEKEALPDAVLCSSADRAVSTAERICEQLKFSLEAISQQEEIYNASVRNLLEVIHALPARLGQVLLVGHNPALTYLAEYLSGDEIGHMEPGAIVKLEIEGESWEIAGQRTAHLQYHLSPEQITFNN
jgi:phosphohistidine phosphatase